MADEFTKAALYWIRTFNKKVKEKIWMVKLIELLNEYENTLEPNLQIEWTENWVKATPLTIISKQYWFIKWLVENDKIDFREDFYLEDQHWWWFGEDEDIIMLLAIQDEPIRFLCDILK